MRFVISLFIILIMMGCSSVDSSEKNVGNNPGNIVMNKDQIETIDDDYYVEIGNEYVGVYLPIEYINGIRENKSHSQTINAINNNYHNYLIVERNKISSNFKWHDRYAIDKKEVNQFQYINEKDEKIIIDDKNNRYKIISVDIKNANDIIEKYIAYIILRELIIRNIIILNEVGVKINNRSYKIYLDDMFFPKECNLIVYNRDENTVLGLKIIKNDYLFYKIIPSKEEGLNNILSDEVVIKYSIDQ